MNTATPAIQNLARRLTALEGARAAADEPICEAARACDKLRAPLSKLVGVAGFRSLMARALVLAKAHAPSLESVHVGENGSLAGFDAVSRQHGETQCGEAGAAVVAQLLGLLVTFMGEPLTMRLVDDAWPDADVNASSPRAEGHS